MIVDFEEIRPLIPGFIFNEYGQLTGHFVHRQDIVCVVEDGRVRIWLNQDAYEKGDLERLICDYDEKELRAASGRQ